MFKLPFKNKSERTDVPEKRGFTYNPPPPNVVPPPPPPVPPKRATK